MVTARAGVGICLPVHDEEVTLSPALASLHAAIRAIAVRAVECRVAVVLDDCSDGSEELVVDWARRASVATMVMSSAARNVGMARQLGCLGLLRSWSATDPSRLWLATTDADSEVPPHWLAHQLDCMDANIDFWAGRVEVSDWSGRTAATQRAWTDAYRSESDPIHGANMGMRASVFLKVGGFPPLASGEDAALRAAMVRAGCTVRHDRRAAVRTSSRSSGRARSGFADHLDSITG